MQLQQPIPPQTTKELLLCTPGSCLDESTLAGPGEFFRGALLFFSGPADVRTRDPKTNSNFAPENRVGNPNPEIHHLPTISPFSGAK